MSGYRVANHGRIMTHVASLYPLHFVRSLCRLLDACAKICSAVASPSLCRVGIQKKSFKVHTGGSMEDASVDSP